MMVPSCCAMTWHDIVFCCCNNAQQTNKQTNSSITKWYSHATGPDDDGGCLAGGVGGVCGGAGGVLAAPVTCLTSCGWLWWRRSAVADTHTCSAALAEASPASSSQLRMCLRLLRSIRVDVRTSCLMSITTAVTPASVRIKLVMPIVNVDGRSAVCETKLSWPGIVSLSCAVEICRHPVEAVVVLCQPKQALKTQIEPKPAVSHKATSKF